MDNEIAEKAKRRTPINGLKTSDIFHIFIYINGFLTLNTWNYWKHGCSHYLLSYLFWLNTLKDTKKAPAMYRLRLNILRDTKIAFWTPKRYNEDPVHFYGSFLTLNWASCNNFPLKIFLIFQLGCGHVQNNELTSPGYPGYYPSNMDCSYTIYISHGKALKIDFQFFEISDCP